MNDCLKDPKALLNAEALASHVSTATESQNVNAKHKSGTNSSKSGAGKGSNKMKSSQSNLNQSVNKSNASDTLSGTDLSGTGTATNAISSETVAGEFANMAKNVQYVETELPESMMKAIRIIERLLTQIDYHEQHVLYKNYPPVKLSKSTAEEEDDEETKKKAMMIGRKKDEKKKEEEEKKEGEEEDKDPKKISVKSLFTFECDITAGRQVSCIDISEANPDLIAVGYGEYDISCVDDSTLKKGILAFWTLKNPNFPEKIIYHDHSITCCAFSKKKPN